LQLANIAKLLRSVILDDETATDFVSMLDTGVNIQYHIVTSR